MVTDLDRLPVDDIEKTIVNAFKDVSTVEAIWVRYVPTPPLTRVYLTLTLINPSHIARLREIKEGEFTQHMRAKAPGMSFEFKAIGRVVIPPDMPSRIWRRDQQVEDSVAQAEEET